MKTAFSNSNKDNVAITTLIAVGFFVVATGFSSDNAAVASQVVAVQKFDTIVVTASRASDVRLDTIVVTASRKLDRA